jgi:hypothetical protein
MLSVGDYFYFKSNPVDIMCQVDSHIQWLEETYPHHYCYPSRERCWYLNMLLSFARGRLASVNTDEIERLLSVVIAPEKAHTQRDRKRWDADFSWQLIDVLKRITPEMMTNLSERDVNEEDLPIMHLLRADGVATDDVRELFDKLGVQAFTFRLFDRPATLLLEGPKTKEKFLDDLKNEGKEDWFSFVEYRQAIYSVD